MQVCRRELLKERQLGIRKGLDFAGQAKYFYIDLSNAQKEYNKASADEKKIIDQRISALKQLIKIS